MADKKELPVSGDLFLSYGQTNVVATSNCSRASSSSNFNPLVTAVGFNPMASGYPGGTMAAFYSSPFSMLPYAAAAAAATCNASNSVAFMNTHTPSSNMLSAGFQHTTNPVWSGLLPPDYLLNIAALQNLQQQPTLRPSLLDGNGESFNDILKKMPKAPSAAAGDDANSPRVSSAGGSVSHEHIPAAVALSNASPLAARSSSHSQSSKSTKQAGTSSPTAKASSTSSCSFSATSLAVSDQKLVGQSSRSTTKCTSGRDSSSSSLGHHRSHHSSSLATLAEIASSLQNNDRSESRASKDEKQSAKKDAGLSHSNAASSQNDQPSNRKIAPDSKDIGSEHRKTASVNGASALDFSRKRPSSKLNMETEDVGDAVRRKEPKIECTDASLPHLPSASKVADHAAARGKSVSKKDEKDSNRRHVRQQRQDQSSVNDSAAAVAAAAAATLFGNSLSADLKMDPNLLNASAMAWAALSNQWLFANMQTEILNRAAAAAAVTMNQQNKGSTANGSIDSHQHNLTKSSSTNAAASGSASLATTRDAHSNKRNEPDCNSRRISRGRPVAISSNNKGQILTVSNDKDAVDVTIDAVIKQQQNEGATTSSCGSGRRQRKAPSSSRTKRGRGSRGGITVREQLAARRGNQGAAASIMERNGQVSDDYSASTDIETGSSAELLVSSARNVGSKEQTAALDLSVKSNATQSLPTSNSAPRGTTAASVTGVLENGACRSESSDEGYRVGHVNDSCDVVATKKRRVAETDCVRLPLTKGWRRQTYIRGISPNCVRGDVIYYAPCGKRLGSYAEVVRYLHKHDIKDISRDNFSFSGKVLVGDFLHIKSDGNKNGVVKLTEKEVVNLLSKMHFSGSEAVKDGGMLTSCRGSNQRSRRSGNSRRSASRRHNAIQTRLALASSTDALKADSVVAQQSTVQCNRQAWESRRMDRERESISTDERKRKLDYMRNQKVMEAMQRAKEKDIRQQQVDCMKKQERQYMRQMVMLANAEREKVRQQMLFARVLDARRRQDEKERLYAEKLIRREERMAARTATLMKLRQMRQPVEDMELEETKELPNLDRMENMQLDGQAFADIIMVMEFVNNFGQVLKIDKSEIPNISDVHAGLLNDRRGVQPLRNLVKTLLLLVLEYPGLPAGNSGKTLLGQPAKDVGVTDMNMSELLRMFLLSRDEQGKELGNEMNKQPYEALPPSRKAAILAYMCNELVYCRNVVREIEGNIDVIAKVKSDRWSLEGKIRHMKVVRASKRKKESGGDAETTANDAAPSTSAASLLDSSHDRIVKSNGDEDEDDDGNSSDSCDGKTDVQESNPANKRAPKTLFGITAGEIETISKEEKQMSIEEVDKELERLNQDMHDLCTRVNEVSVRVRCSPFGQDRYNRYYWILPHYAGIFVEGVESGGVRNPAVKMASAVPVGLSNRSASPSKQMDAVRSCVQDMVETVSRLMPKEGLDSTYAEVKAERSHCVVQETEICVEPQKLPTSARVKMTKYQANKKMKPIPMEMQQGWWSITDPAQLDSISPNLHHRGIRERLLNRILAKHEDNIKKTAFHAGKTVVKFDPVVLAEGEPELMTLRTARRLLNMTRQLEEKVFQANVHVRERRSTVNSIHLMIEADERSLILRAKEKLEAKLSVLASERLAERAKAKERSPSKLKNDNEIAGSKVVSPGKTGLTKSEDECSGEHQGFAGLRPTSSEFPSMPSSARMNGEAHPVEFARPNANATVATACGTATSDRNHRIPSAPKQAPDVPPPGFSSHMNREAHPAEFAHPNANATVATACGTATSDRNHWIPSALKQALDVPPPGFSSHMNREARHGLPGQSSATATRAAAFASTTTTSGRDPPILSAQLLSLDIPLMAFNSRMNRETHSAVATTATGNATVASPAATTTFDRKQSIPSPAFFQNVPAATSIRNVHSFYSMTSPGNDQEGTSSLADVKKKVPVESTKLVLCPYCSKMLPGVALNEHQELFCWQAPKNFGMEPRYNKISDSRMSDLSLWVKTEWSKLDATMAQTVSRCNAAIDEMESKLERLEYAFVECGVRFLSTLKSNCKLRRGGEIDALKELLKCPICAHRDRTHLLECGHLFCFTCVEDVRRRDALCPTCRAGIGRSVPVWRE